MKFGFSPETRRAFFWKLLDLAIVILVVSIAFQLSNLKQHADQRSIEEFYVESHITDMKSDIGACNTCFGH